MYKYQYKISCIMAVYNVGKYIDEAIKSILKQNIGFRENVQLILVNDGSTDNSGDICDKYKSLYPENIVVVHKENQGVAATKNKGLEFVKGEFVTFIDPDDMISKGTMKEVYTFFTEVKESTNVVAIPIYYFEGKKGRHPLNNKFEKENSLVDLMNKPEAVLLSTAAAYYSAEALKVYSFFEELVVSEDFRLNYEIFKDKPFVGLVPKGKYLYRRRDNQSSLIKTRWDNPRTYIPYMEHVHAYLLDEYKKKFDTVPKFLQYALMYDLQWILQREEIPEGVLSQREEVKYWELIIWTLGNIEEEVIYYQKYMDEQYKLYALSLKEEKNSAKVLNKVDEMPVFVKGILEKENSLELKLEIVLPKELEGLSKEVYFRINKNSDDLIPCEKIGTAKIIKSLSRVALNIYEVRGSVPKEKVKTIEIFQVDKSNLEKEKAKSLLFEGVRKGAPTAPNSFMKIGQKIILKGEKQKLIVSPKTIKNTLESKAVLFKRKIIKGLRAITVKVYFGIIYNIKIKN